MPEIDLCHYDSDKTYAGRLKSYRLLWPALRLGGYFISDDIDDNLGFAHFCRMVREEPLVVQTPATQGVKYVGLLVKRRNEGPRDIMF